MKIDEHIKNLEEYCEDDDLFEKDGDFKEFCDNHIADIKAVIKELRTTQSDLYEANNRIVDYMDIIEERDRMIDWLVEEIHSIINLGEFIDNNINKLDTKEQIKEYFEERCKNAKD